MIHRDIKPANIFLQNDQSLSPGHSGTEPKITATAERGAQVGLGSVKIVDFGLARALEEVAPLTQSGAIAGTPAYMAPEQALGDELDHRCDLFSLGCVLYRMIGGQPAFKGKTAVHTLSAVLECRPQPLEEIAPDVPPELGELVAALLQKDRAQRPTKALEIADRLAAMQRSATDSGSQQTSACGTTDAIGRTTVAATNHPKRMAWLFVPGSVALGIVVLTTGWGLGWFSLGRSHELGDYLPRPDDYLRQLADRWRDDAARPAGKVDRRTGRPVSGDREMDRRTRGQG